MKYQRTGMIVLLLVILLLNSCVILPVPTHEDKVLTGTPVSEKQIDFLSPGMTTRQEVIDRLGNPSLIWEDANVYVYSWEMRDGILYWAVGAYLTATAGMMDIPKHYLLLIQFDKQNRVERFGRKVRPSSRSFADFLKEWQKYPNIQKLPDNLDNIGE